MKFFGGNICGHKKQSTQFVATGDRRGSYPVYVCDKKTRSNGGRHDGAHYDSVHKVQF